MRIKPIDFLNEVIRPTLIELSWAQRRINSVSAEQLLLGTAIIESNLDHVRQMGGGPALSPFQIEPVTMKDMTERFLPKRPKLMASVNALLWPPDRNPDDQLQLNMRFACAIARVKYWSSPIPLAKPGDWGGHADVWKRIYNTHLGKGKPEEFVRRSQQIQDLW